jgi:serine protease Do
MAGVYRRGTDWLAIAILLATFIVVVGVVTLGTAVLAESRMATPRPTATARAVFSVPTRAATPTRFPSPTPASTSTRAPTPTSLATSVPSHTPTATPIAEPSDDLIKATVKSVVRVTTASGSGTAFRLEGGGAPQFLTNWHVVDKASSVTLVAPDGSKHTGTVARREAAADLAVITAGDLGSIPALSLAADAPSVGAQIFVVGYPSDAKQAGAPSVTRGAVTGRRIVGSLEYTQTDAKMGPGSSGGPVVSASGKVLGVAALGLRDQSGALIQGASFAIPAGIVLAFLRN